MKSVRKFRIAMRFVSRNRPNVNVNIRRSYMNGLRNQIRTGAAIAATVAGLMLCVTPACAAPNDQILENDGDECGTGHSPLVVYEPIDANEGESS